MAVQFYAGDLFADTSLQAFAHGCNCAGAMGAGIAVAFRDRWPEMYDAYRARCDAGTFQLGDIFVWDAHDAVIYNLGTQQTWRPEATLAAIEHSIAAMLTDAAARELPAIALPRIGAGLGGLAWDEVRTLLVRVAGPSPVLLQLCERFEPGQPLRPV